MARPPASPALRFFAPRDADELAAACAWVEADESGAWTLLDLPVPRLHPRAPELFAAAAGVPVSALRAVLERVAYIADDGAVRLWPWYPEEDAEERPRATVSAARLGVALPGELLDEPYEPAYYLRRAGMAAVRAWLAARGIDADRALIARVVLPTTKSYPAHRHEGGLLAQSRVVQAGGAVSRAVDLFAYVSERTMGYWEAQIDAALVRLCAAVDGVVEERGVMTEKITAPIFAGEGPRAVGRVCGLFGLADGALLICDGAFVVVDRAGAFVRAWPLAQGSRFARGDVVVINQGAVLDLAAGEFLAEGGELAPVLARVGLAQVPGTAGHDERTSPELSACGRYLLDVDESPYIVRLADRVVVAEGRELERVLDPEARGRKLAPLVEPAAVEVTAPTILDGVRFFVGSGPAAARDGRSLAFALAGDAWRFLVGDGIWERGRRIARLGVTIVGGAFRDDGAELWALAPDHWIRVDLAGEPRIAGIFPLAPVLAAAREQLEVGDA